jgi:hypothetical protein
MNIVVKSLVGLAIFGAIVMASPKFLTGDELKDISAFVDFSRWRHKDGSQPIRWLFTGDYAEVVPGTGDIETAEEYQDFNMHLEFWLPLESDHQGQARANSGIYIHGLYELQILDSSAVEYPTAQDCGALYKQVPPLMNACKGPLVWQTYDIEFRAPRVDQNNRVMIPGEITAWLNGELVLNQVPITKPTGAAGRLPQRGVGPIRLQDHQSPVRFRNVVITPRFN